MKKILPFAVAALTLATGVAAQETQSEETFVAAETAVPAETATDAPAPATETAQAGDSSDSAVVLPEIEVKQPKPHGYIVPAILSATRTDTALVDIPQSITVVTHRQIRDQSMQSLGDVVMYVPGVGMAQGEGNRETPIFRGSSSTSDFFVDGLRDDTQYYRDLYNIDRVEVLKGPNAMIFGRGGVGGVLNRVTRQADWTASRELVQQLGMHDNFRTTVDVGDGFGQAFAARVTGLYEDSESYRDGVTLKRSGVNPTVAFRPGADTLVRLGAEYFHDERIADRGQPSFRSSPFDTDPAKFFGVADLSDAKVEVRAVNAVVEHNLAEGFKLRNNTRYADYSKFYQNVFAGGAVAFDAVDSRLELPLSAYNVDTQRQNFFNQTDLVSTFSTFGLGHTLLTGVEIGRQDTISRRLTGFFPDGGDADANPDEQISVAASDPTTSAPVTFASKASDAHNDGTATIYAAYVQDQVEIIPELQFIAGVRFDRFEVDFNDKRPAPTGAGALSSTDNLVSPRAGLIYKPMQPMSIYVSYSKSYLPRAGEQLGSLNATTGKLDPEEFENQEIGAKYDLERGISLTAAVYQLDRSNVAIADPANPGQFLLVDGQRTHGVELGFAGSITPDWVLTGGYAYQDAQLTATTGATAKAGAAVAQVPYHSASLWNRYDFTSQWGAGVGVQGRSSSFATTSNLVELDGYVRVDGAVFYRMNKQFRAQLNVENLLDEEYYPNAHTDNNITPGSPLAVRFAVTATF